ECGVSSRGAVEASDVDQHLVAHDLQPAPREGGDLRLRELTGKIFGEDARDAVTQRLAPLVELTQVDLVRGGPRDDLRPVEIAGQAHGADSDGERPLARDRRPVHRGQPVEAPGSATAPAA